MGKKRKEEIKIQIVKEALSGIKVGVLARMYDLHPETIRLWVKEYRDS
ncbi:transposase, partial [Paenibacillus vini]